MPEKKPWSDDETTKVPEPFHLQRWLKQNENLLADGKELNLFEGNPDKEIKVMIIGGNSSQFKVFENETWLY